MKNEIIIIYNIDNNNNQIRIFGNNFVENNKDKCLIEVEGKRFPLIEYYNVINKTDKNSLKNNNKKEKENINDKDIFDVLNIKNRNINKREKKDEYKEQKRKIIVKLIE